MILAGAEAEPGTYLARLRNQLLHCEVMPGLLRMPQVVWQRMKVEKRKDSKIPSTNKNTCHD